MEKPFYGLRFVEINAPETLVVLAEDELLQPWTFAESTSQNVLAKPRRVVMQLEHLKRPSVLQ